MVCRSGGCRRRVRRGLHDADDGDVGRPVADQVNSFCLTPHGKDTHVAGAWDQGLTAPPVGLVWLDVVPLSRPTEASWDAGGAEPVQTATVVGRADRTLELAFRAVTSSDARLANFLAESDADLSDLDVDEVLVGMLDRIRSTLNADTAAVLLRDGNASYLTARAARGLEEEVRQGVRVPIGVGFAGTIAASLKPVMLERVDSTTVANPILWEKGVKVMLGVPLIAARRLVGVLHVGRLSEHPFTQADVDLLESAAERVSATILARSAAIDLIAGRHLERSLQPTKLPTVGGLEFAARYVQLSTAPSAATGTTRSCCPEATCGS